MTAAGSGANGNGQPTISGYYFTPAATSTSGSGSNSGQGSGYGNHSSSSLGSSTPIGPIVGGVVGCIFALAICGCVLWFVLRQRGRHQFSQPVPPSDLPGISAAIPDPNNTAAREPVPNVEINDIVSPVSLTPERADALIGNTAELHTPLRQGRRAEVPGDGNAHEMAVTREAAELEIEQRQPLSGNQAPVYEMPEYRWNR